jgi:hypothetical protein
MSREMFQLESFAQRRQKGRAIDFLEWHRHLEFIGLAFITHQRRATQFSTGMSVAEARGQCRPDFLHRTADRDRVEPLKRTLDRNDGACFEIGPKKPQRAEDAGGWRDEHAFDFQ